MDDLFDNHKAISNKQHFEKKLLRHGSVKGKIQKIIDSRTIIFVKKGHNVKEAVARYRDHMNGFHWIDHSGNMSGTQVFNPKKKDT